MKTRFLLVIALGLLAADVSRSENNTIPYVLSSVALGSNLLEKMGAVAEATGYRTEVADVRADAGGIQLVLPGLVLRPADNHEKSIRLPVVIAMGRGDKLLITFHAISHPREPLPDGSSIRIVLRQQSDDKVIADQTTKLTRGWSTPTFSWVVDRDRPAGEFFVEIIPTFAGPLKIALPQALLLPAIRK